MTTISRSAAYAGVSLVAGATMLLATPAANAQVDAPSRPARGCPSPDNRVWSYYKFGKAKTTYKATNLKSDYLKGPGTISYTKTKTATVGGSVTGTVSAEAGIVFAKASASIAVTANGSWSWGHTWSYSLTVPKGKTARMVMFHQMKKFSVAKYQWYPPKCGYRKTRTGTATGPSKYKTANVWRLQYR